MIDIYNPKEGEFEIVDVDFNQNRSTKVRIYKLIRFGFLVVFVMYIFAIFFALGIESVLGWLVLFIPLLITIVLGVGYWKVNEQLIPRIANLWLKYDKGKNLTTMRVREWLPKKEDEYIEDEVRFNQAIGFKVVWEDDGLLTIYIVVDPDYPGTAIFETYDHYSLAELIVLFEVILSDLDKWFYELEDGSEWPEDAKKQLNKDIQTARVPWQIRRYFSSTI